MGLTNILSRDDVPQDVKQAITTLEEQLDIYRKEFEELKRSEVKYRTLFESAPDTVVVVSPTGQIIDCNNAAGKLTGLSKEELLGKHFSETGVVLEEDLPRYIEIFSGFFEGSQVRNIEVKTVDKDGMIRFLDLYPSLFIKDDEIQAIQVIVHDITKRRQVEEALKASEEKFRKLFNNANDAIFLHEITEDKMPGQFIEVNEIACQRLEYNREELLQMSPQDIDAEEEQPEVPEIMQELLTKKKITFEMTHLSKNRHKVPVEINSHLFTLGGKEVILSIARDITDRKLAEKAIQESEEKYRILLESAPIGISTSDFYGKALTFNQRTLEMMGYTANELKTIDLNDTYVDPNDRKELLQTLQEHGSIIDREVCRKRKDGSEYYVLMNSELIELGGEKMFLTTVRDITKRRTAEEEAQKSKDALYRSEKRFRELAELLPEFIFETDKEMKITFANKVAFKKSGYTYEDLQLGVTALQMLIPEDRQRALENISLMFAGEKPGGREYTLQRKDGSTFPVMVFTSLILSENEPVGLRGIIVDMTEKKLAEEAVRKERDRVQQYIDISGVMFVAIDKEGQVTLINKKGCEILGYDEQEILGKNWFDNFLPEQIRDNVKVPHKQLLRGEIEIAEHYINPILRKDGEERIIAWHNTIIKDEEGSIIGHLSSGEDITERIIAERIREELEERRENFIYMTTHELRTPLTVIGGYCDFLSEHDEFIDHPRREKIYNILRSNVNRLERLTRDVSHIVQLERGELPIEKSELDICSFLKSILEPYDHLLENQFSFQGCFEEPPITIHADSDRLQQVMENIISNAIKQTPKDKREIIVSMESSVNNVQIFVSDNGAGIAPEHLETIFEQFITIPTDYTAMGTGIGLYLSQEIIKAHGGTITAQSPGKGRGSTFTINIPRNTD